MRNFTVISMALTASGLLLGLSPASIAQTWVETHPALSGSASRMVNKDAQSQMKPDDADMPYRVARLRPDQDANQDDDAKPQRGSLDHPANAGGESSRHE